MLQCINLLMLEALISMSFLCSPPRLTAPDDAVGSRTHGRCRVHRLQSDKVSYLLRFRTPHVANISVENEGVEESRSISIDGVTGSLRFSSQPGLQLD